MFCPKCGKEIQGGASYCPGCGNPVGCGADVAERRDTGMQTAVRKKNRITPWIVFGIIMFIVVVVVVTVAVYGSPQRKYNRQISLAERYLNDLDYDKAIAAYQAAIRMDPKSAEAYLGLAEAYIGLGDSDKALDVLKEGYEQTWGGSIDRKMTDLSNGSEVSYVSEDIDDKSGSMDTSIDENLKIPIDQSAEANICIVKDGHNDVKIRALPVNGSEVAKVNPGDILNVFAAAEGTDGYTWYEITGNVDGCLISGFIRSDFVEYGGDWLPDSASVSNADNDTVYDAFNQIDTDDYVVIKEGKTDVKIRALPVNGSEVAKVNEGDVFKVISTAEGTDGYTWYEIHGDVRGNTIYGYVRADFVYYYEGDKLE